MRDGLLCAETQFLFVSSAIFININRNNENEGGWLLAASRIRGIKIHWDSEWTTSFWDALKRYFVLNEEFGEFLLPCSFITNGELLTAEALVC